jgi:murein DD-endopeptidase MepM/ murein hydrolase activator NlpD
MLFVTYFMGSSSLSFLKSSVLEYKNITSDPFDGTISPIAYVPDWSKSDNMDKSRTFESFTISDFIEIPEYDTELLADTLQKTKSASVLRYVYPVVYMGSYRGNYTEYDGSHAAVDIRAPIGTPVVSIANGVVVKVKNLETGDGKYVIIRHDNVEINGVKETLYSGYEHLSEIIAIEGNKIKRGEVLGKVGMTGITTTPHLHFQIDRESSPFHMYWPYTFKEAADL